MRNEDKYHYAQLEELQMRIADCAEAIGHLERRRKRALYRDHFLDADDYAAEIAEEQTKMKMLERSYELIRQQK